MNIRLIDKRIVILFTLLFAIGISASTNTLDVNRFRTAVPVIDGKIDEAWENVAWEDLAKILYGRTGIADESDCRFKVSFDEDFIYLMIQVADGSKRSIKNNLFYSDSINVFLDFGNEKSDQPDNNDYRFSFSYNQDNVYTRVDDHAADVRHKWIDTESGYILEARILLNDKKIRDGVIGFDIIINDVDSHRLNRIIAWSGDESDYYSASRYGTLYLTDDISININFGKKNTKEIENYFPDMGQEYGIKPNGYTYGWNKTAEKDARDLLEHEEFLTDSYINISDDNSWKISLDEGYYKITISLNDIFENYRRNKDVIINEKRYFYKEEYAPYFENVFKNDPFRGNIFNTIIDRFKKIDFKNIQLLIEDYIRITSDNPVLILRKGTHGLAPLNYIRIKRIDDDVSRLCYPEDDTFISADYRDRSRNFGCENRILINSAHRFSGEEKYGVFEFNLYDYSQLENASFKIYLRNSSVYDYSHDKKYLKLFAVNNYDFDEKRLTWSNCDLVSAFGMKQGSLIDSAVYIGEQDITGRNNTFISFNISDYLSSRPSSDSFGKVTFILMQEKANTECVRLFSKEVGFNAPVVEMNEKKRLISVEGCLLEDQKNNYVLHAENGEEYYLASNVFDLDKYRELILKITGYVLSDGNPTGYPVRIMVEMIYVFPPEKVIMDADTWNNDGFPIWHWNAPARTTLSRFKLNDSPWTETKDFSYMPHTKLEEGDYTLYVQCKNEFSDWSEEADLRITIDLTPPQIVNIHVNYSGTASSAYYIWQAVDNYSALLSYEYSFDNANWTATDENKCIITTNIFNLFNIRAKDQAGNWSNVYSFSARVDGLELVHDDGAELTLPPDSTNDLIFINIESVSNKEKFDDHKISLQSNIFHFSSNPENIQFGNNCELKLKYRENDNNESKLKIFRFDENTREWEPQDTIVNNTDENYIITRITHFSYYAVGMAYFRVGYAETNGEKKWCFLDQGGNPFYSTGMNTVNGTGHYVIRDNLADYPENYPWDETKDKPRYYDSFYQYVAALIGKYGSDNWKNKWFEETVNRLNDWNFTTLGPWGTYRTNGSDKGRFDLPVIEDFNMPYVMMLNIAKNEDFARDKDVFSDEFDELLNDVIIRSITPERVYDPNLIGYYYVGEYDFGPVGYNATGPTFTDMFYEYFTRGADHAGKQALIKFLKDFYNNDIDRFKTEFGLCFTHSGIFSNDSHDSYPEIRSFDDLLNLKATSDLPLALSDKENFIFILPVMLSPKDLLPDMKSIFDDVLFKYDAIINRDWDKIEQFRPDISDNYTGLKNLYFSIESLLQDYPQVKAVFDDVIFADSTEAMINSIDSLSERIFNTIKSIDQMLNSLVDSSQIGPLQVLKGYLEQMQIFADNLFDLKTVFNEITDAYDKWSDVFDYPDVRKEWLKYVAETYFKKCQQAIKAKDANHLILGTEFIAWATPVDVVEILAKYTDVVSVNYYNLDQGLPEDNPLKVLVNYISDACDVVRFNHIEDFYRYSGKPVMIGEFSFVADENLSGCPNSQYRPLPKAKTQTERAEMFEREASGFIDSPYIIGYHWFENVDQPPEGRGGDKEDFNVGVVSINDEVYEELTAKMKVMNGKAKDFTRHNVPIAPDDTIVTLTTNLQQPPEKVTLHAVYWNTTGYPQWNWEQPVGADLFRFKLDEEAWIETTQLFFVPASSLGEGSHLLTVQCKSMFSGWSEPVSREVMIDKSKPIITAINYEPRTTSQKGRITWTASDNYTASGELTYEIELNDESCTIENSQEYLLPVNLYEGTYIFKVAVIDKAGNKSAPMQKEFTIEQSTFINSIYTIETKLSPYHYLQISDSNTVTVSTIENQNEYLNSRFKIHDSFIAGENYIVLESVSRPGFFLRKSGTDIILSAKKLYDNNPGSDPSFQEDITFVIQPGLGDRNGFSLASYTSSQLYVKVNNSDVSAAAVDGSIAGDVDTVTYYFTRAGKTTDLTNIITIAEFEALTKYDLDLSQPIETIGTRYIGDAENADSHLFVKSCYDFPYYHGYEAVAGDDQGDYRIVIWKGDYDLKNDGTFINNTAAFFWSLFTQNQNKDDVGYFGSGAEICIYKKKTYKIKKFEELLMLLPLEEGLTLLEELKQKLLDALGNIDIDLNDYMDENVFENIPTINSDLDQFIFYFREFFKVADYDLMRKIPNLMHGFELGLDPSPNRIIQRIGEYLSDSDNMSNFMYEFIWVYAGNPVPAINNIMKKLRDEHPEDFEYTHYMPYSLSNFEETSPPLMQFYMVSKVDKVVDGDVIKKGDVIVADKLKTWWLNCWTGKDGHGQELQWNDVVLYFKIDKFYNDQWQRWDHNQQEGGWGALTDFLFIDL